MAQQRRFADSVVLVTGGGSGIGQATCVAFAREGARVAYVEIDHDRLDSTRALLEDLGADYLALTGDVANASDVQRTVAATLEAYGTIDVLVNNAGIISPGGVVEVDESSFDRMMAVNLKAVYLYCREVLPHMCEQGGGKIVNVASTAALEGLKQRAPYTASKAGVLQLTRSMALDYAADSININAVCPGSVRTGLTRMTFADPVLREQKTRSIPMGRFAEPEEIAAPIVFLCSSAASYVTGAALAVDGGLTT